jgi:tRNA nucleotidyltransferase/poly(A) polymerase
VAASDHAKPTCRYDDALAVLTTLRDAGHLSYFAGGCVRDRLLGLEPKDWDVVTDAPPQRVRSLFRRTQAVGQAFGVILVHHNGSVIEVATFRSDGVYSDGRRPDSVTFATPEADARRRDFTINGLFLDPIEDRVIDHVGGRDDLAARTLRAIGSPEARFDEDYLRVLRAIRFAARFGFEIEPRTLEAIRKNVRSLIGISPERVGDEMRAMLVPPTRRRAVELMRKLDVLPIVLRFLPAPKREQTGTIGLFDLLAPDRPVDFPTAVAAMSLDYLAARNELDPLDFITPAVATQVVQAVRQSLRISNEESARLEACLILDWMLTPDLPRVAKLKRFLAMPHSDAARLMLETLRANGRALDRITRVLDQLVSLDDVEVAPDPLLTGEHLIAMGFTPGPAFREVLDFVYDEQLEGRVKTEAEAYTLGLAQIQSILR